MNHAGFFSGIGGFEEAFRRAGAKLVTMCEIEPQARRVLRRHFPGVEIINDVKEITRESFAGRAIDVFTGGFPCQDLSVAGRRAGLDGERSGLWFEYLRIITDHKPRWVVIENVPGLLSSFSGDDPPSDLPEGSEWETVEESDFAIILRGLVELGYCVAWRILDSQFDGVAQRRERVFIVASLGTADCAEILFEREGGAWDPPPSREAESRVAPTLESGSNRTGGTRPPGTTVDTAETLVAQTLTAHQHRSNGATAGNNGHPVNLQVVAFAQNTRDEVRLVNGDGEITGALGAEPGMKQQSYVCAFTERTRAEGRNLETQDELAYALTNPGSGGRTHSRQIAGEFGVRRLTPTECEALQGFPRDWTRYGDDGKEISDSARYRMLGNAICLPTVEWIARRIIKLEEGGLNG